MRVVSDDLDAEVTGTTVGDRIEVHAWRGGSLLAADLFVSSWSIDWSADRQVQGQATLTVADPDGDLAPWGMGDALAPGGSRLQLVYVFGASGLRVPLGWWRIRSAEPSESWRVYPGGVWVTGGGTVTVRADELTAHAGLDRLDAEVVTASTCVAEVRRLLAGICPVVALDGVTDSSVPSGLVYSLSRLDAVDDLLSAIDATYRMGADGSLEVVPVQGLGPVWTITGGDDGVRVRLARALSDRDLYNAAISTGQTATGAPLVGRAYLTGGPLAWDGPFGRVPVFHQAVAQTTSGVAADAATVLANRVAAGEVDLVVDCLTHPGIQLHDRVTVVAATVAGDQTLEGSVVGMSIRSAGGVPAKAMGLLVRVSAEAMEAVAASVAARRSVVPFREPYQPEEFVLGVTVPDETNTGLLPGVSRTAYTGSTSITGSTNPDAPTLIENVNVTDLLTVTSGYVSFVNVAFSGSGASTNTALVDCRATGVSRVTFDRCDFDPGEAGASVWLNAVIGHHMTVNRCRARRVVDFVGSYNTFAAATDNIITGNLVEWLVRFDTDPNHADGTHNDMVQHQGGTGLQVVGNAFHGYCYYADGTTPTDPYTRVSQGVLVQENVAIAGTYHCGGIEIRNNWIWGHMHPLVLKTRSSSYTTYSAAVLDNVWMNADQRNYGGTYLFYNIRLDLGVTLLDAVGGSPVTYPVGATLNTEGNDYEATVPTYGGNAVYVRRDNLYGG